jgi:hypothetical protein
MRDKKAVRKEKKKWRAFPLILFRKPEVPGSLG